jgi:hypothetical protein
MYWVSVVDLYCAIAFSLPPLVSACRNRTRSYHYSVAIVPVIHFRINGPEVGPGLGVSMVLVSPFYSEKNSTDIPRFQLVRIGKVVLFDVNFTSTSMDGLKHNRPLWVAVQGLIRPTPYTYIHGWFKAYVIWSFGTVECINPMVCDFNIWIYYLNFAMAVLCRRLLEWVRS